jgi:hypothetical protein
MDKTLFVMLLTSMIQQKALSPLSIEAPPVRAGNLTLGFQGGVCIPLVKGGVKAPPAKRQCRAGPKAGARRSFT